MGKNSTIRELRTIVKTINALFEDGFLERMSFNYVFEDGQIMKVVLPDDLKKITDYIEHTQDSFHDQISYSRRAECMFFKDKETKKNEK